MRDTSTPRRDALSRRTSLIVGVVLALTALLLRPRLAAADSGYATWYGPGFQGHTMADGQPYNMYDPTTTASNLYPFGTWVAVTNPANGLSVTVQVRDRGAFRHAFDLSYAAFRLIADPAVMGIPVTYQVVSGPSAASAPRVAPSSRGGRPAPPTQYVVQPGDSLSGIASQFGIDQATLASWNGIGDPNAITVGQTLRLTAPPAAATPAASATTTPAGQAYVVQAGDTIYGIAAQFGVGADRLVTVNGLADPSEIQIGQSLTIPPPSASSPRTYVVQPGDTLSGIADKFGITVGDILFVNQIDDPNNISEGFNLAIPGT